MKIPTMVDSEMKKKNLVEFAENNLILFFYEFINYCSSNVNIHDFGRQLLNNKTVKQYDNHHSGSL